MHRELTPHDIASEFLDQWERVHSVESTLTAVDYNRLGDKLAAFEGGASLGEAGEIHKALTAERKARGGQTQLPALSSLRSKRRSWRSGSAPPDRSRNRAASAGAEKATKRKTEMNTRDPRKAEAEMRAA
jgi:hypothetical protein